MMTNAMYLGLNMGVTSWLTEPAPP